MGARIEISDPLQYAGVASRILQAAWKPPCLLYSTDYLAWQFGFPSDIPKRAAVAFLEGRAVGCIAVTARRFTCGPETLSAYVLSFVAVDPSASGQGIARTMYASLLEALPEDVPVFAFAEPDSIGERLLARSFSMAAFRHHVLRPCRAMGYLRRPNSVKTTNALVKEASDFPELTAPHRSAAHDVIWTNLSQDQWAHYRKDPRRRAMVSVSDADGNAIGSAMFVAAEILSAQGIETVPMLESVELSDPTPDAIAALFESAAKQFKEGVTVVASNLSYMEPTLVKAAGIRALPSLFNAHVFVRGQTNIVETSAALNLEVI